MGCVGGVWDGLEGKNKKNSARGPKKKSQNPSMENTLTAEGPAGFLQRAARRIRTEGRRNGRTVSLWRAAAPTNPPFVRILRDRRHSWRSVFGLTIVQCEAVYRYAREAGGPAVVSRQTLLLVLYFLRSGASRLHCASLWEMTRKTHQSYTDRVLFQLTEVFDQVGG